MKILLIGYGKMGKAIERIARARHHDIVGIIDAGDDLRNFMGAADCAIEFTAPEAAPDNLRYCFERKIPVVCGTTGWLSQRAAIEQMCLEWEGGFFYASNYSLGVNLFFKLNEILAQWMNAYPDDYQPSIEEIHHTEKKDAPSGTAITLSEGIIKHAPSFGKKKWTLQTPPAADEIKINVQRLDKVPGTHIVAYQSAIDDIEIKHTAHSRDGFALGAIAAAEWMANRQGIYSMKDFLK